MVGINIDELQEVEDRVRARLGVLFNNTLTEPGQAAARTACEEFRQAVCDLLGLDP